MNQLILIKHAMPQIDETKSSAEWQLSDEGRACCKPLAEALRTYNPELMITSAEPKAKETGQLAADHLQIECTTAPDLHEHDRTDFKFIHDKKKWYNTVKTFFDCPDDLIFGKETAAQARNRFTLAIESQIAQNPNKTIAIAAHGTVISLFVAQKMQADGFDLWQQLNLPSFLVLDLPSYKLNTLVPQIN